MKRGRPREPEPWILNFQEAHRQFPLLWGPNGKLVVGRGRATLRKLVIEAVLAGKLKPARRLVRQDRLI